MSRPAYRRRTWRTDLLVWAGDVREQPYSWGRTDCGALAVAALVVQFGEAAVRAAGIPGAWLTLSLAAKAWQGVLLGGGLVATMPQWGAQELALEHRARWPMGSILLLGRDEVDGRQWPAFGIYVEPVVVGCSQGTGVQWMVPESVQPERAWLFEQLIPTKAQDTNG